MMESDPFPLPRCIIEPFDHEADRKFGGPDMYVLAEDRDETVVYLGFSIIDEGQYVHWSDTREDFVFDRAEIPDTRLDYPPVAAVYEWDRNVVFEALLDTGDTTTVFTPYAIRRAYQRWVEAGEEPYWESLQAITFTDTGDGLEIEAEFRKGVRKTDNHDDRPASLKP